LDFLDGTVQLPFPDVPVRSHSVTDQFDRNNQGRLFVRSRRCGSSSSK
jgi:hypothetical protein